MTKSDILKRDDIEVINHIWTYNKTKKRFEYDNKLYEKDGEWLWLCNNKYERDVDTDEFEIIRDYYKECKMKKYPESEKMKAVSEQSQICGEFLEWLISKYNLIRLDEYFEQSALPIGYSSFIGIERVLAEYFGIDMNLVEQERRVMIEELTSK
jgi:DNA integrity scanning protein DisA with diadenylate cyclase activity